MEFGLMLLSATAALAIGPPLQWILDDRGIQEEGIGWVSLSFSLTPAWQMSATSLAIIPLISSRRPSNSFLLLPHCYDGDTEQIPYRFTVIREERRESPTWHFSTEQIFLLLHRLSLAAPPLAPLLLCNRVHPHSSVSPHWFNISHPQLVDALRLPFSWRA